MINDELLEKIFENASVKKDEDRIVVTLEFDTHSVIGKLILRNLLTKEIKDGYYWACYLGKEEIVEYMDGAFYRTGSELDYYLSDLDWIKSDPIKFNEND